MSMSRTIFFFAVVLYIRVYLESELALNSQCDQFSFDAPWASWTYFRFYLIFSFMADGNHYVLTGMIPGSLRAVKRLSLHCELSFPNPLPISTILEFGTADGSVLLSASVISNTSRTPWIILISEFANRIRPLTLWISKFGFAPLFEGNWRSHSTERSHASTNGTSSSGISGNVKERVVMSYRSQWYTSRHAAT